MTASPATETDAECLRSWTQTCDTRGRGVTLGKLSDRFDRLDFDLDLDFERVFSTDPENSLRSNTLIGVKPDTDLRQILATTCSPSQVGVSETRSTLDLGDFVDLFFGMTT